jgi:hypothetical protein
MDPKRLCHEKRQKQKKSFPQEKSVEKEMVEVKYTHMREEHT